jgi:hypothetical protein
MSTTVTFLRKSERYQIVGMTNVMYLTLDDEEKQTTNIYHVGDNVPPAVVMEAINNSAIEAVITSQPTYYVDVLR